ncbi:NAD(P)/FAD-dependent oxidoreductase [Ancylobacter amanitiformis]|uniref:Sarcosine oxidase subunit beta n=1 Tax=Ancylobacter amanitiformis TaxID=217069 RepID=A0ABU0LS67_9HYPH|nr:FAD-binding oxidoreductase [Ancylobacter amanitiformis]MDQ0511567.1 sarcosine oxidase subunit beta [Ancylobacter amanitiformis]
MTNKGTSVVVVGGGVTGLSTAWWLARSGVDVTVLEKGIVGFEASGRNGGGCTHYQSPLFHEEQRLWPQMDELLGYPTEYRRERIVFQVDERKANFADGLSMRIPAGYEWEVLDGRQVRERVPLAGDNAVCGVHLHFGGHANPQRTSQAYAWAARDLGVAIHQHVAVSGFETAGGRVVGVETSAGRFGCDALVIAAGPQTGKLSAMLGNPVPMAAARAEMIVTEPLPLMPTGGVDGNGLYGRQTLRGNLAYGGGPHEWYDDTPLDRPPPRPSGSVLRGLSRRLADLLPRAAHARVIRSWAGVIENTPDGRPVIERLTAPDNVTVATMSSVGFGLSPASGHAIRDLVLDGVCSFADLSKLSSARFKELSGDWRRDLNWLPPQPVMPDAGASL